MFTGIVEGMGKVVRLTMKGADALLEVDTAIDLNEVSLGDSIAVNGACLTATSKTARTFTADVSAESLSRTTLKFLQAGHQVNLEKSLRIGGFLGGHFVLGHVDGIGRIMSRTQKSGSIIFAVESPEPLSRFIVEKGSVAVDGISLTVNRFEKGRFYVNIIPHTAVNTTLTGKKEGEWVNIETDILGKYVEKLLQTPRGIDKDFLAEHGFIK
ncbi:MAG: Riboflavin synthase [Deltaproteobacteria bacterium ADurb.Bin151]|jgi:riboflavin synthase|nr:riboflavin synthase [Smithella sp.]OQB52855.1 MAG: Riboflavin synthase [Deltaproteobacteria bacterium ADurb.Bin151]HNZ11628.1 riboflavin synthase [Smithellaceae bacterium]HOG82543.1 riboflavin synthase [Smithellaceae bacterium]HOQ43216.1 riboflavin synthase [Smithellaceae bacterium]